MLVDRRHHRLEMLLVVQNFVHNAFIHLCSHRRSAGKKEQHKKAGAGDQDRARQPKNKSAAVAKNSHSGVFVTVV